MRRFETGQSALAAADRAFAAADRVLAEDIGGMTEILRDTLGRLDTAIAQVAADVPEISGALRETADSANAAFAEVERTAAGIGPPVRAFADSGLAQYAALAREMRTLVGNLDRIFARIDRDPARYFLGNEPPAFRR
jgi:phospholipid/cholesterol/gamma-HCH transport system substrate-binding protein